MENFKTSWFIFFVFAVFFVYGAGIVDGFINYKMYFVVGPTNLWLQYKEVANKSALPIAGPALLLPFISIAAIWLRPASVPRSAVIISVALTCASELLTIKLMWPLHHQLAQAWSEKVMNRLMFFDHWVRKGIQTINIFVVLHMLYRVTKSRLDH